MQALAAEVRGAGHDIWPLGEEPPRSGKPQASLREYPAAPDAIVACLSRRALKSVWLVDQLAFARIASTPEQGMRILPVRFDDVPPPAALADISHVDLFPGEAYKHGVRRLLAALPQPIAGEGQGSSATEDRRSDDAILDTLFDGDNNARVLILSRLRATARTVSYASLRVRLLDLLFGEEGSPQAIRVRSTPGLRAWLLSALSIIRAPDEKMDSLLGRYADHSFEPDEWVRYWTLAGIFLSDGPELRQLVDVVFRRDPSGLVKALAQAIQATWDQAVAASLQHVLRESRDTRYITYILRALRIVALPPMVEPICELLSRAEEDHGPYHALHALAHPSLVKEAAAVLTQRLGTDRVVDIVLQASRNALPVYLRKYSMLVRELGLDTVIPLLQKIHQGDTERAGIAQQYLEIFGVTPVPLEDVPLLASIVPDLVGKIDEKDDKLSINAEVRTLCSVLLAKNVSPPLSVGLFGDWGTGKSFFMERMRAEIDLVAALSEKAGGKTAFHSRVVQITFNAWHYIDTNLWASLVSHIFDELAQKVVPQETPEQAKGRLLKELDLAKTIKAEATAEKTRAESTRKEAEDTLAELSRQRAEKEIELADLRVTDLPRLLAEKQQDELRAELTDAMKRLGIPAAVSSVESLEASAKEVHSLAGRARAALLAFHGDSCGLVKLVVLALALLALVPLGIWFTQKLMKQPSMTVLATSIAEVTVFITGLTSTLKSYAGKANEWLTTFEGARSRALKLVEEKRKERGPQELELEKSLAQLRTAEDSARERLSRATARVQEIEQQLQEIDAGRSLSKFLLERSKGDDYRKHLGLISIIRKDFDRLYKLLRDSEELRTVDRIILYIDDLDRCPADKVVDVLQAVHLLLAVKLFVVVVGVDSRWLLHSLERQFSAFQQGQGPERGDTFRETWVTTPQAYLEKIFQIPFTLRRMQPDGYQRLMSTLLLRQPQESSSTSSSARKDEGSPASPDAELSASNPGTSASISEEHARAVPPGPAEVSPGAATETPRVGGAEGEQLRQGAEEHEQTGGRQDPGQKDLEKRELTPRALEIRSWEGAFADRLHAFVPTPRAAKRFANVYRLLKAGVSRVDLPRFEGTEKAPGEFQAAMLLLALLTGFPRQALTIFPYLLEQPPGARWSDVFKAIETHPEEKVGLDPDDARSVWKDLEPILNTLRLPDQTVAPFCTWASKVARFSFEAARSVGSAGSADARRSLRLSGF